jgi:hypothetical protein
MLCKVSEVTLKNSLKISRICLTAKQRCERAAKAKKSMRQRLKKLLSENDILRKGSQHTPPTTQKAQARRAIETGAERKRLVEAEIMPERACDQTDRGGL